MDANESSRTITPRTSGEEYLARLIFNTFQTQATIVTEDRLSYRLSGCIWSSRSEVSQDQNVSLFLNEFATRESDPKPQFALHALQFFTLRCSCSLIRSARMRSVGTGIPSLSANLFLLSILCPLSPL